jgi:hypothetical protein
MIGAIGGYSSRSSLAWRGMASADYELLSSLQRTMPNADEQQLRQKEQLLIEAARNWGLGYGLGGWSSDLQLLADLQHYGTATRLLDVTSNPMTALWFACQPVHQPNPEKPLRRDGVLIAINTNGWKRYGRGMPGTSRAANDNPFGWELEHAVAGGEPFVVESLTPNDRLRAQEGFFISSAVPDREEARAPFKSLSIRPRPIEPGIFENLIRTRQASATSATGPLEFAAIRVPHHRKARILQRLENSYNRHPHILFPDFAGFLEFNRPAKPRDEPYGATRAPSSWPV